MNQVWIFISHTTSLQYNNNLNLLAEVIRYYTAIHLELGLIQDYPWLLMVMDNLNSLLYTWLNDLSAT